MRIGILGVGAVGSYFGGKLALAGFDAVFVGRGAHIDKIKRVGLAIDSTEGYSKLEVSAVTDPAEAGECDWWIFAVKSPDTVDAARELAPQLAEDSFVVSLQNGVDNEEKIAGILGRQRVVGGLCYVGARIDEPGTVVHSAAGRVIIGELKGNPTGRLGPVCDAFEKAGVPVKVSDCIEIDLWSKLFWNLSFNSVSALTRSRVDDMLSEPRIRGLLTRSMEEAVMVARGRGIDLGDGLVAKQLEISEAFGSLKTSMLQDVEKGNPLEADALNGVICLYGRELGVPTPVNDTLYALLTLLSRKNSGG